MKKILLAVVMLVVFPLVAEAAPFLVCDVYPSTDTQPTFFKITKEGGGEVNSPPQSVTGGVRLHYDMAGTIDGVHNWTVAACNDWGCSTATPFGFTKTLPGAPAGVKLESQ
jgi:hypothetical protein